MSTVSAVPYKSSNAQAPAFKSVAVKTRKRFYVAQTQGYGLAIISLRQLISGVGIAPYVRIVGPFRTFNDAVAKLEALAGVVQD